MIYEGFSKVDITTTKLSVRLETGELAVTLFKRIMEYGEEKDVEIGVFENVDDEDPNLLELVLEDVDLDSIYICRIQVPSYINDSVRTKDIFVYLRNQSHSYYESINFINKYDNKHIFHIRPIPQSFSKVPTNLEDRIDVDYDMYQQYEKGFNEGLILGRNIISVQ